MSALERRVHKALLLVALALALVMGGAAARIEEVLAPVRTGQQVRDVVRTASRACWTWASIKARQAVSDNIDVFIDDPTGDRSIASVFNEETGASWRVSGNVPAGAQFVRLCVLLPPHLRAVHPLRVEQLIYYRGWLGLWHTRVAVPTVYVGAPP